MGNVVPENWREEYARSAVERFDHLGGGNGRNGGNSMWQQSVETRLQSLDTRLGRLDDKMDRNFLVTWGGIIVSALGLAGLMARGFGWL